jgi:hypothetical protein
MRLSELIQRASTSINDFGGKNATRFAPREQAEIMEALKTASEDEIRGARAALGLTTDCGPLNRNISSSSAISQARSGRWSTC